MMIWVCLHLKKTNFFKQLISAEISLEIEPKESISFQIMTEAMASFADRLFLPKSRFRKAENMPAKLLSEKCGILNWCIEGLACLIANDFKFIISKQERQNLINSER